MPTLTPLQKRAAIATIISAIVAVPVGVYQFFKVSPPTQVGVGNVQGDVKASTGSVAIGHGSTININPPPTAKEMNDIKLFVQCDAILQPVTFPDDGKIYNIQLHASPAPYGIGFGTISGQPKSSISLLQYPLQEIYGCKFRNYHTQPVFKISLALHLVFIDNGATTLERAAVVEIPILEAMNDLPFTLYILNMTTQFVTVTLPTKVSLSDGKVLDLIQPQSYGMHFGPNQTIARKD
jgi:hypothetical protein